MLNPARKFRPSAVKNLCTFPSTKLIPGQVHQIRLESIHEKDYCYHLEFDNMVATYRPQPETFNFPDPDSPSTKQLTYTPDFQVIYQDGTADYIEVKPIEVRLKQEYRRKMEIFAEYAGNLGYGFQIVDRIFIYRLPLLGNYQFLHRYRAQQIQSTETVSSLRAYFPGGAPLIKMLNAVPRSDLTAVYGALASGQLEFDMHTVEIQNNPEVTYA